MGRVASGFEDVAGRRLPLGGKNVYLGVRGKQGWRQDQYQGCTPNKKHRTGLFDKPFDAAMALAELKEDIELGMLEKPLAIDGGALMQFSGPKFALDASNVRHAPLALVVSPVISYPQAVAALLTPEQAAMAAARGVAAVYVDSTLPA